MADYVYEWVKVTNKNCVLTPRYLVDQIFDLINIKNYKSIWLPFDNYDSEFKLTSDELKLNYFSSDLYDDLKSDFFTTEPPINCDLVISNPPFNLQNEIIERLFNLIDDKKIKSFVLLLPLSTLETPKRSNLYEKYSDKLSIIIFKKRIKFKFNLTSFNTACCWICYNISEIKNKISWL